MAPFILDTPPPSPGRSPAPPEKRIDWQVVYGNTNPVEVEVGSGKGLFLVTAATLHPNINYLGIEIVHKYQLYIANRLARRRLHNAKAAYADARWLLQDWIADASVQAVHLYFPDPWWKLRHHKRRVFTDTFAAQALRILVPGGDLLVVTDVADYAAMVRETVAPLPFLEQPPPAATAAVHDMDYLTNFERKFRQEGRSIHRMRFRKPVDPLQGQP